MKKELLDEIKRSLELSENDLDEQLTDFINRISQQLKVRLGFVKFVPEELEYIVVECTIKRFNRKGNEGMDSYNQEGESISYGKLLDEFIDDIQTWVKSEEVKKNVTPRKGVASFI